MTTEFIQKVIRIFFGVLAFLCCLNIMGLLTREAHQYVWVLASYILFALLLRNIWLTLFVWLTVFLYSFFKFKGGEVYLTNIFAGCVFFYLTKIAFEKRHIDWFINMILWVLVANLLYGILQVLNWDFIYTLSERSSLPFGSVVSPFGFMSNTSIMATFIALCIPLVASRKGHFATITALALMPMFWILHASSALIATSIVFLFVMYFKYTKKLFIITTLLFVLLGSIFFVSRVDKFGTERFSQWKLALYDAYRHPITGWGLDSFRSFNYSKGFVYGRQVASSADGKQQEAAVWDNPHNLIVSLQYEFGFLALFFLGGYIRQCIVWFRQSDKSRNVIALAGFIGCFLIVSIGHFPAFLARIMVFAVPCFALYEIVTKRS